MLFEINNKFDFNFETTHDVIFKKNDIIDSWLSYLEEEYKKYQDVDLMLYMYYFRNFHVKITRYNGEVIASFYGLFPKSLLAQVNTHRTLSKNAASSRAIPFNKNVLNIVNNIYIPVFTLNQKGMQGEIMGFDKFKHYFLKHINLFFYVLEFIHHDVGVHKQNINRYLEPFMLVPIIVTGNANIDRYGWRQFINLRYSDAAQREIGYLAKFMSTCLGSSFLYDENKVHNPDKDFNVSYEEVVDLFKRFSRSNKIEKQSLTDQEKKFLAVFGKIARVSTLTIGDDEQNLNLALRLIEEKHMSPFEHVLVYMDNGKYYYNTRSFSSFRYAIENKI